MHHPVVGAKRGKASNRGEGDQHEYDSKEGREKKRGQADFNLKFPRCEK